MQQTWELQQENTWILDNNENKQDDSKQNKFEYSCLTDFVSTVCLDLKTLELEFNIIFSLYLSSLYFQWKKIELVTQGQISTVCRDGDAVYCDFQKNAKSLKSNTEFVIIFWWHKSTKFKN